MSYIHFIGIDVSKEWFDAALHDGAAKPQRFPNTGAGFAALARRFAPELAAALVVLESTGGYEAALIAFLLANRVAVHRANPLAAKHFIRSVRLHGKTDQLDARALARYGAERHASLRLCRVTEAAQQALQALLSRRADLLAMRVAEQNRSLHPGYADAALKESLRAMRKLLDAQLEKLERRIAELIAQSPALSAKFAVLTSVKGVGRQTAFALLAGMPELGSLTRRQAASLAGVAPHPRDSGKAAGYRRTIGGRYAVKSCLFMAAMAARRYNAGLKAFFERLVHNGKKPMVALVAVMRKLVTILNAKLRDAAYA